MYGAIFTIIGDIIKFLWPLLLAVFIFFLGYNYKSGECEKAKEKRDIEIAQQTGQVNLEANIRIANMQNELAATKQKIKEVLSEHNKVITDIAASNSKLLDARVRREQATCSERTLSNNTRTTSGSNDPTTTGDRTFLEESGESLIEQSKYADELTESLRACRTWVTDLKQQFDNKRGNSNEIRN